MKKISILGLCAFMALGAMAQESVIKEAERAQKGGASMDDVVKIITPAFTDPSTAQLAITYYLPGKAAFDQINKLISEEAVKGPLPDDKQLLKARLVINGYDYYMKALPLDTVVEVDKKGKEKIKTKYSKEIINTIGGYYNDFNNAAITSYNNQNYKDAYKAWEIYTSLPENPAFAKAIANVLQPDSVIAEIIYNQGLAAWQMEDYDAALKSFKRAIAKGFNEKNVYDYALAVASSADNQDAVMELAEEANGLYGKEDPKYMGVIINNYLITKDYDTALKKINQAISETPEDAEYYFIRGVLYEQEGIDGDPIAEYKKAISIDPNQSKYHAFLGRMIHDQAVKIYNDTPDDANFGKAFTQNVKPLLLEAVAELEKAYELDNDDRDTLRTLSETYYLLNDDANQRRVEELLKY